MSPPKNPDADTQESSNQKIFDVHEIVQPGEYVLDGACHRRGGFFGLPEMAPLETARGGGNTELHSSGGASVPVRQR